MIDLEEETMNLKDTTLVVIVIRSGFHRIEQPTNGTRLNSIRPEHSLATPLKLATNVKPSKKRVLRNYV